MLSPSEAAERQEAEKKMVEAVIAQCGRVLDSMRDLPPREAERVRTRLDDALKDCPKLPPDFRRKASAMARSYECAANMRAADAALHEAMHRAREDDKTERNRLVDAARQLSSKVASLGANDEFRHAVRRKIENIMMTGGVEHKGPTPAKPGGVAHRAR